MTTSGVMARFRSAHTWAMANFVYFPRALRASD